jgi:hypothetical protein
MTFALPVDEWTADSTRLEMWPSDFRKKKPYTADELNGDRCDHAAERIKKARVKAGLAGEIIHIAAPDEERMQLGPVHPPGGGVIIGWYFHRAVRDGDRIYDKMTGCDGMSLDEYKLLFEQWDTFTIRVQED